MKKRSKKRAGKRRSAEISQKTISLLIENSVALQKTLTNLAGKLDGLSREVAEMLSLFREASKAFAGGKKPTRPAEYTGGLREKLDILIEQSRTIAKGLVLLEGYIKEKISAKEEEEPKPKALPQFKF